MVVQVFSRKFRRNGGDEMNLHGEYRTEREAELVAEDLRKRGFQTVVKVVERGRFREGVYESAEGSGSRPQIG